MLDKKVFKIGNREYFFFHVKRGCKKMGIKGGKVYKTHGRDKKTLKIGKNEVK